MTIRRLKARSFLNAGVRTVGFGDIHKGPMAPEGFDFIVDLKVDGVRAAIVPELTRSGYAIPGWQIAGLKSMMSQCQMRGLHLFPVIATSSDAEHEEVWQSRSLLNTLVDCVIEVVRVARNRVVIGAIDILNEPRLFRQGNDQVYWNDFVCPVVNRAASIDPKRVLAVETWPGARVDTQPEWGEFWIPQPDNVVMSIHGYSPFGYTHSDMAWAVGDKAERFDPVKTLAAMHNELLYAVNVARKYSVPIWMGELSTRQDRPGAAAWAQHKFDLCRGFGISTNWHYIFGAKVWHPNPATLEVIREWHAEPRKRLS